MTFWVRFSLNPQLLDSFSNGGLHNCRKFTQTGRVWTDTCEKGILTTPNSCTTYQAAQDDFVGSINRRRKVECAATQFV